MNKVLKIIFICLVVAGAALAAFTDVPIAEYSGIALALVGAAMACVTTWNKAIPFSIYELYQIAEECLLSVDDLIKGNV